VPAQGPVSPRARRRGHLSAQHGRPGADGPFPALTVGRLRYATPGRWRSARPLALALATMVLVLGVTLGGCSAPLKSPSGPPRVLFSDSFSSGNWCKYNRVQNVFYTGKACDYVKQSYALTLDNGAARFEVRPGDSIGGGLGGGERSELSQDSTDWQAHEGDRWHVHERLRLAPDFKPGNSWTILTQFHAGSGSPPLSLQLTPDGALTLHSAGKAGQVNLAAGLGDRVLINANDFMKMRGQWFEVDLDIQWSQDVHKGGTAASINGETVAPWRAQKTMSSDRCYWKGGIYRAPSDSTLVMWMNQVQIAAG
jgi:hypothetical protein